MKKKNALKTMTLATVLVLSTVFTACGTAKEQESSSSDVSADAQVVSGESMQKALSKGTSDDEAIALAEETVAAADLVLSDISVDEEEDISDSDGDEYAASAFNKVKVNKKLKTLLKFIDTDVEVGTAGSTIVAKGYAELMVEWASDTNSSSKVIKKTVKSYRSSLSKDERKSFDTKMELVDSAYQELLEEQEELDSVENVELVMKAAKIR